MENLASFLQLAETPAEEPPADPFGPVGSMQEFAERVLNSADYRASLFRRIQADELPAQIEALFYYYAAGKPTERVEHSGKNGAPIEVTEVRRVLVPVSRAFDEDEPLSLTQH